MATNNKPQVGTSLAKLKKASAAFIDEIVLKDELTLDEKTRWVSSLLLTARRLEAWLDVQNED